MQYKIAYRWVHEVDKGAASWAWNHNYHFVTADSAAGAEKQFKSGFDSAVILEVTNIEQVGVLD